MVAEWSKILKARVRAHVCAYIIFRDKLNKKACEAKTKKFIFFSVYDDKPCNGASLY